MKKLLLGLICAVFPAFSGCSHFVSSTPGNIATSSTLTPHLPSPSPGLVFVDGTGWTLAGLEGPPYRPGECRYRTTQDGFYLPDPACTPGAVDDQINEQNISSTICSPGYVQTLRPPESVTEPEKFAAMAAYSTALPADRVEYDHLIPLSLGGASTTQNLWPEPDQGSPALFDRHDPFGENAKDGVEDLLHYAVCHHLVGLREAQQAIAFNWTTAVSRLGLSYLNN